MEFYEDPEVSTSNLPSEPTVTLYLGDQTVRTELVEHTPGNLTVYDLDGEIIDLGEYSAIKTESCGGYTLNFAHSDDDLYLLTKDGVELLPGDDT